MAQGVFATTKKDGTPYYRVSLTRAGKHISLGSFPTEIEAYTAYQEGLRILKDEALLINDYPFSDAVLSFEKIVVLFNFRDNGIYIKTPIYLRESFFEYWFSPSYVLKFDIDDLFYYSSHKIQRRGGHLFVSDYGSQITLLSRYGIRSYAVSGRDFEFVNQDETDYRYANIRIKNAYYGVEELGDTLQPVYKARIHINGNYSLGTFPTKEEAAIAYNKACDLLRDAGLRKNYPQNYLETLSPREYAEIYSRLSLSRNFLNYIRDTSFTAQTPSSP